MGKKAKTGKSRKDKFYQLAKETGYRARSAFKLIQLNRKYEFLQKSKVVIDLCAAPGGWLQVVAENTPVSSVIVGVDLVKIKPIQNVITLQEDITTDKCRQSLRKELQTWKADCVLNDGAPNVGKNWIHDAYQQAELTLMALKLATDFLKSGGWFVTKVFRSKDYNPLLWVFQQLFKHVFATKPKASRTESAEIFVVCQGYLAPNRIDPKFLDPKHVFKEVEPEPRQMVDLIHPEKQKRHRDGYAEGEYTCFHELSALEFVQSKENYLDLLASSSAIILDDEDISNNPLTTDELKECLKDIKVLGKRDLKNIIKWRKQLRKEHHDKKEGKDEKTEATEVVDSEEDDDLKIEEKLAEMKEEEKKNMKKKLKKVRRERIKLRHKMDMKMILPDDMPDLAHDTDLFNLTKIKNKKQLKKLETGDMSVVQEDNTDDEQMLKVPKRSTYDRDSRDYLDPQEGSSSDSGEEEPEFEEDSDEEIEEESDAEVEDDKGDNPLLVDLEDRSHKTQRKLNMWYSKDSFANLDDDEDEMVEISTMMDVYEKKGGKIKDRTTDSISKKEQKGKKNVDIEKKSGTMKDGDSGTFSDSDKDNNVESDTDSDSDSDYDERQLLIPTNNHDTREKKQGKSKTEKNKDFEVVSQSRPGIERSVNCIGCSRSSVNQRNYRILPYHLYTFDDEGTPDWFHKDEIKHCKKHLPVTKADIEEYRMRLKAIDAQPIKKIAEAKSRKKRKMLKKMERIRKRAETLSDTVDISEKERWQQIKQMYKKAGLLNKKKEELTYIVAKKGIGKRVRRPQGVQGPFRVVDPRMKKDNMRAKTLAKNQRKGRSSGKAAKGKNKR
ncbi:hypothetical protein ScPMuIL_006627 [Solemya velum]